MGAVVPEGAADPAATPPQTARLVNLPNALTMFRLAVVPLFAVLLLSEGGMDDGRRVWATLFFALAIITDRYDGMIARRTNQVTEFGKLADPIADKALTGTALLGLSVLGLLPWWVTLVILVRELGVTLLRFWVIRHGVIAASRGGKAKTVLQAVAIGLYILPLTGVLASARWWVMAAALVLTVITGIDYVYRALTLRRTSARAMQAAAARRGGAGGPAWGRGATGRREGPAGTRREPRRGAGARRAAGPPGDRRGGQVAHRRAVLRDARLGARRQRHVARWRGRLRDRPEGDVGRRPGRRAGRARASERRDRRGTGGGH